MSNFYKSPVEDEPDLSKNFTKKEETATEEVKTKEETQLEDDEKDLDIKTIFTTEIIFQAAFTLLFLMVILFCDFVLGESLYLNKILLVILFIWTHIPAFVMYIKFKKLKFEFLCLAFLVEIYLVIQLYLLRNKVIIVNQINTDAFSRTQLERAVDLLENAHSCLVIFRGKSAKDGFIKGVSDNFDLKTRLMNYCTNNAALRHKIAYLIENKKLKTLSGLRNKLLIIYENNEKWDNYKRLIEEL